MTAGDVGRLLALAAIWGASFLFTRVAAPQIGPLATTDLRMLIGGLALLAWFRAIGFDPQWRRWIWQYMVVGLLTSALPFLLYGYAALEMSAGAMSIVNATSPMWGALWSALLLAERITPRALAGLGLGICGVALVANPSGNVFPPLSVAAAGGAACLYGLAGAYMKRWTRDAPARGMAVGTQVTAALVFLPLLFIAPPPSTMTVLVAANVLALGLLSSAVAYILYFRLIADLGATGALTVTYLIPVFGVGWGALFLGESLSPLMLAGAALVIVGTFLVLRK